MPTRECKCGARYRFPESAIGKRAKCQKCGAVLVLEAEVDLGPLAIADELTVSEEPKVVTAAYLPSAETPGRLGQVVVEQAAAPPNYAQSLLQTLLFPTSLANLATFIVIWALLFIAAALLPYAGCIGLVGQVIVFGWYSAFRFGVIEEAAAGEKELPTLALTNGPFDDIIAPLFKWLGSWAIVVTPAFVALAIMAYLGLLAPTNPIGPLLQGVGGMLRYATPDMIVFVLLIYAGMFLWPIIVLCVALGGFASFARPDLIVLTLTRTFHAYLLTAAIVFATGLLSEVLATRLPATLPTNMVGFFARMLAATGIELYFEIVAMRAIGLYYHHFKEHFAWSWE